MRKLSVVAGLLLVAAMPLAAQTSYGFRAGLGTGWLSYGEFDSGEKPGLVLGAHLHETLSTNVVFRPSLTYLDKGGRESLADVILDLSTPFLQASAPLLLTTGQQFSIGLLAGPWLGFRVGCSASITGGGRGESGGCGDDDMSSIDFGWLVGIDLTLHVSDRMSIGIDGTGNAGLKNLAAEMGTTKTVFLALQGGVTIHP